MSGFATRRARKIAVDLFTAGLQFLPLRTSFAGRPDRPARRWMAAGTGARRRGGRESEFRSRPSSSATRENPDPTPMRSPARRPGADFAGDSEAGGASPGAARPRGGQNDADSRRGCNAAAPAGVDMGLVGAPNCCARAPRTRTGVDTGQRRCIPGVMTAIGGVIRNRQAALRSDAGHTRARRRLPTSARRADFTRVRYPSIPRRRPPARRLLRPYRPPYQPCSGAGLVVELVKHLRESASSARGVVGTALAC